MSRVLKSALSATLLISAPFALQAADFKTGQVVLNQPLEVPQGHARVFIQDGQVVRKSDLYPFRAHCNFEVEQLGHAGNAIQTGSFLVTKVQWLQDEVVRGVPAPTRYASLRLAASQDYGPALVKEGYHFWLNSKEQPEVMRLTCHGTRDDQGQARPPTQAEMSEALGQVARLVD